MLGLTRQRLVFLAVALLVAAAAALAIAVRWAVDPATMRQMAESRLSAALGQPVKVGGIRLSFFPSIVVTAAGISVRGTAAAPGTSLDIRAVHMRPVLSSILRRPVVIERVDVDGVTLKVRRDESGHWLLPISLSGVGRSGEEPAPIATFHVTRVSLANGRLIVAGGGAGSDNATIDRLAGVMRSSGDTTRLDDLTASLGGSTLEGSGRLTDAGLDLALRWRNVRSDDLPQVFGLLGMAAPNDLVVEGQTPAALDLHVDHVGRLSATGRVAADRAALGTLTMTRFASPLTFGESRLALDGMTFSAYGGAGRGRVVANSATTPPTWSLAGTLAGVDIGAFLDANSAAGGRVTGKGTLDARLSGSATSPVSPTVGGRLSIAAADGAIRDFPLVAAIYSALGIGGTGGEDLRFESLTATFEVANQVASTADLVARTGELSVRLAGTIGFDQALALTGVAAFSRARSDAFTRSIRELGALRNAAGEMEVPVSVSGTLGTPRFSVDVVGMARKGLENEIRRGIAERLRDLLKKK